MGMVAGLSGRDPDETMHPEKIWSHLPLQRIETDWSIGSLDALHQRKLAVVENSS